MNHNNQTYEQSVYVWSCIRSPFFFNSVLLIFLFHVWLILQNLSDCVCKKWRLYIIIFFVNAMLIVCMRHWLLTTLSFYALLFIFEKNPNPYKKTPTKKQQPPPPQQTSKQKNKQNKQTSIYRLNGPNGKRKFNKSAILFIHTF